MHQSQIGTNNTRWSSNQNLFKLMLKYIIKFEQPKKMTIQLQTQPHTKLTLFKRHKQNTNITTVQILMLFLQWLCCEVWEGELSYLWQQLICHPLCHRLCSLIHRYIMAPNSGSDCALYLRISNIPVHMSHVTFLITLCTSQVTFLITLCTCLLSHF